MRELRFFCNAFFVAPNLKLILYFDQSTQVSLNAAMTSFDRRITGFYSLNVFAVIAGALSFRSALIFCSHFFYSSPSLFSSFLTS